jgi:hypothetical protein
MSWIIIISFTVYYLGPESQESIILGIIEDDQDTVNEVQKSPQSSDILQNSHTVEDIIDSEVNLGSYIEQKVVDPLEDSKENSGVANMENDALIELGKGNEHNGWSYQNTGDCLKDELIILAVDLEHKSQNSAFWDGITDKEKLDYKEEWREFVEKIEDRIPTGEQGILYVCDSHSLTSALTSIEMLRFHGCNLPVEVWIDKYEFSDFEISLIDGLENVVHKDIAEYFNNESQTSWRNAIKEAAMLYTEFDQFIYLDSGNMPVIDPTFLFETPAYEATGTLFWKDFWKTHTQNPIWDIMGISGLTKELVASTSTK